jgi:glycosyltransferase involved in cell wall biosynthesis
VSRPAGVSIIIPNYNYARFLGEAIDSALAQRHAAPVEVIVVDDGSTDESRAVIEHYGERITAVFQANAGQTRACMRGLERASQPVVVFLDSDDRLMPEAASLAASDWPEGASKKQFRLQVIDAAGRPRGILWPKYPAVLAAKAARSELLRTGYYPCPPTSGNAFSRAFLDRIMPFDNHPFVDSVVNTLAPLYGDVVTQHEVIAQYRVHGANNTRMDELSASRFERYLSGDRKRIRILDRHCRRLGVDFAGPGVLRRHLPYRELEVIAGKLRAESARDRLRVAAHALATVRTGFAHPQKPWHRLLRGAWIAAIGIVPRPLAEPIIRLRYASLRRSPSVERLIGLFERRQCGR